MKCIQLAVALLLTISSSAANNWPSFRGNNGDGIGTGDLPTEWNVKTGENIRWKKAIPGLAISSPIIWRDRLLLTTAVGSQTDPEFKHDPTWGYRILREQDEWQFKTLCLNRHTGKTMWEATAFTGKPKQGRHSESTYANPTPATDGTNIIVSFGSHGLFCYGFDGKLKWTRDLGQLSGAPSNNKSLDWGYSSSPIIHGNKVIVQCDTPQRAFIAILDLEKGKEIMSINRRGTTTWATPTVTRAGNRKLIICNGHKNASAFDLDSGKRIWWLSGRGDIPVPRPIIHGQTVILTSAHGGRGIHAIDVNATGELTPTPGADILPDGLRWWSSRKGSYIPTPLAYRGIIYVAAENGIVTALDASSGSQHYQERLNARRGGMAYGSPVTNGRHIYIPQNDGKVHVIGVGNKFKKTATNDMGESTMASPAITAGNLYLRTRHHLYCISETK